MVVMEEMVVVENEWMDPKCVTFVKLRFDFVGLGVPILFRREILLCLFEFQINQLYLIIEFFPFDD